LAGVRASTHLPNSDIPLIRPLLWARKVELEAAIASVGVTPALDSSNANPAFDRVRVRQNLAENEWLDPQAIAASAGHLAEAWRALEWYALLDREEMVTQESESANGPIFRYVVNVPRAVQIETVRYIIAQLGGLVSRSEAGRAADRLWQGENASLGGVLATASIEEVESIGLAMRVWRFRTEPPRSTH